MTVEVQTEALLERIRGGDARAIGGLFELHRERLWRMLHVRLDAKLSRRVSADDVLQEAYLDVAKRIGEYLTNPAVPFYVWLRFLTFQRLQALRRVHLGAKMRDAAQEEPLPVNGWCASSESMAGQLVSELTSPSQAAMRGELRQRLHDALEEMEPIDREILALRHFEEMSNHEVAQALGITKDAASKRHVRALVRLREVLADPTAPL